MRRLKVQLAGVHWLRREKKKLMRGIERLGVGLLGASNHEKTAQAHALGLKQETKKGSKEI